MVKGEELLTILSYGQEDETMTLTDISIRIMKSNIKKYILYLVCNICAIAMFTSVLLLGANTDFGQNDSMITSGTISTSWLLGIFLIFFVLYTQGLFHKEMQRDYSVLMSIGMSDEQMTGCILKEYAILAIGSLIGGIAMGLILEIVLLQLIKIFVGITVSFEINRMIVVKVVGFTALLYVISIVISLVCSKSRTIRERMIHSRQSEEKKDNKAIFFIGIVGIIFSIFLLFAVYRINSDISLVSALLFLMGLRAVLFNCRFLLKKLQKKHLFLVSDWIYYYKRNMQIVYANAIMYFMIMYLILLALVTIPSLQKGIKQYNPYDISFTSYSSAKWKPDEDYIDNLVKKNGQKVTGVTKINYMYEGSFTIFDVDEINEKLGRDYSCSENEYVYIYCVVKDDGYEHDLNNYPQKISIGSTLLKVKEAVCDVLCGRGNGCTDYILLLNHNTYDKLKMERLQKGIGEETLYSYEFSNEDEGKEICNALTKDYMQNNNWNKEDAPQVSCRQINEQTALNSSKLLILLLVYESMLFIFGIYIVVRYKLGMEREQDNKMNKLLISFGARTDIVDNIMIKKIYSIFFTPFIIASLSVMIFSIGTNCFANGGIIGVGLGVVVLIVMAGVTYMMAKCYYAFNKNRRCDND